jgi:hypothetical protein
VHFLLSDVEFHEQLWRIDFEEAGRVRLRGCPRMGCSGRLNWANFPRKVRGLVGGGRWFEQRFGLCCGRCRRRVLPATVRFFGRSSYAFVAALVAAVTAVLESVAGGAALVGAVWRTVARWLGLMQQSLAQHPQWEASRGRLPAEVLSSKMPLSLIEVFGPNGSCPAWIATLRWLAPITTMPLFASRKPRAG